MLTIKSRSFLNLKYEIILDKRIGLITIPFTRLIPSLRFGDIRFNINSNHFKIIVPLKGDQRIGFVASGYRLVSGDTEIASAEFPAIGSTDRFQIIWNEKCLTFSINGERNQIYLDGVLLGSIYYNFNQEKVDALDIGEKIPIEIQLFSYFAYKKYSELSL